MHNFAFNNLRIVGGVPEKEDFVMGMHSEEIMQRARVYETLSEAIKDMDRVIALSRRHGSKKRVDMNPWELSEYIRDICTADKENTEGATVLPQLKIGLVFGRETFGLTDEEAEICDLRCHIPANDKFPSLNLAQAVGVILYEVYKTLLIHSKPLSSENSTAELQTFRPDKELATRNDITESVEYAIGVCDDIELFKDENDKKYISDYLYSLLLRGNATKQMSIDLKKVFNRVYLCFFKKGKGY